MYMYMSGPSLLIESTDSMMNMAVRSRGSSSHSAATLQEEKPQTDQAWQSSRKLQEGF